MRGRLEARAFAACHRVRAQDFSRERELSFARVALLILAKGVKSLQGHLSEFAAQLEALDLQKAGAGVVSKSAFSQARAKLSHTAFIALNEEAALPSVYAAEYREVLERWRGHRLLAIDGSLLCLPAKEPLGAHFGWQESGNAKGAARGPRFVQGRASVLFDVLNRVVLDARLEAFATGERALASLHLAAAAAGDLVTLDRGYCGAEFLAKVLAAGADFVCRVPRNWLAEARALFAANQPGQSRRLRLPGTTREVRLVSVRLSTGELEVLVTSLLEERLYPTEDFLALYGLRWGIETFYGLLKGRLEVERWSGESLEAIRQDFFSSVLLTNIESVLGAPAQSQLSAQDRQRQQALAVNRARSFHALKSHALALFGSHLPTGELLARLTALMRIDPVAKRPSRRVPRLPTPARAALAHLRYKQKHVC